MTARSFFRKYHKWPSLFLAFFLLLFALSGIVLNHRALFSGFDVKRTYLPPNYHYRNWNLAAVRGGLTIGRDSVLVYGNIGVWLSDSSLQRYRDFNTGFPEGIDNRKVSSLISTASGDLYCGTYFGLYYRSFDGTAWEKAALPGDEERVVRVMLVNDSLWVMTRSFLYKGKARGKNTLFTRIIVPPAAGEDGKTGLFKTLWVIHSGEIYGLAGKLFIDFIGLVFLFLTLTGLVYFFTPYLLRRMKELLISRWKRFNRWSLRWHNITGSWLIPVLLLTTLTGMFLRPPLLIAIADARVRKIPFSLLDNVNPWYDRFRDLLYDGDRHLFLLATAEGIYQCDEAFRSAPLPLPAPPLSVMGINVFEKKAPGEYLVGSFSGLFRWIPETGYTEDYITKKPEQAVRRGGIPFGAFSVAGYLRTGKEREVIYDYAHGAMVFREDHGPAAMPEEILAASPLSLWNTALEVHTCRIYESLIGSLYVLLIPLFGLATAFTLVTGFFSWYLGRRKKNVSME